jgi:RND family efflux transporter MFP subunit
LVQWTEDQATPTVAVVAPNPKPGVSSLNLPGHLEARLRAPIYARVSGYVKSWRVDIGDVVKAGQTLAEIDAPDLDQQLLQARADLSSAEAGAKLSGVMLDRSKTLLTNNVASQQEVDQRAADLATKQAAVRSAQANVERLQVLAGYKVILAPFDGVVTERNTDVGALVAAGSSAGLAMFVISDVHKLRVSINVPQAYAPLISIGAKAAIIVPEYPSRSFPATVDASSRAVDPASGTTHMQLVVDNAKGELMPGGYATVHADLASQSGAFRIPASALIFDASGLRVATVNSKDQVAFRTVTIARDLGAEIEIGSGLNVDDRIVAAPPDGLVEGDAVRITGETPRVASGVAAKAGGS